jgi:aspartyl-tRNA(Asn)/glutamyl-tRNA(Gln) amidotransferase subunit B
MLKQEIKDLYTTTIGIECHVQLKTKTKLFAGVDNDAREAAPNTLISPICVGMPGALPYLNEEAVRLGCKAAFAFNTEPQMFSKFDRKHYFYPDLPLGYQITQFDQPIVLGGYVDILVDGSAKRINLTRAHLEADAGKSTHPEGADYSLVDLNRAGTPLLEIVSEPEMHSSAEAKAYCEALWLLALYSGISEANLYYGNMRFDINISVSKTDRLGTRAEIKNLNSFKSVEKAVEYEVERQISLLEKGDLIVQETRGWNDNKQSTYSMRAKEDAHDYRYFPDPDLPPVVLDEVYVSKIRDSMPKLPSVWRSELRELGLSVEQVEGLLISNILLVDQGYFDLLSRLSATVKKDGITAQVAKWIANIDIPFVTDNPEQHRLVKIDREHMYRMIYEQIEAGKINSNKCKELIQILLSGDQLPVSFNKYLADNGYVQQSDSGFITGVVAQVILDFPKAASDFQAGEEKVLSYLVGQVMKSSQGKANPGLAAIELKKQLLH